MSSTPTRLGITPRTRLFLLIGNPVAHSLSPACQNAAIRALGLDGAYHAVAAEVGDVRALMAAVARSGGGGNVTVPHKMLAASLLGRASGSVLATGACNTFWWDSAAGLAGDNTDVQGFCRAAVNLLGCPLSGCRVLLLGAGGAARAIAFACRQNGCARVDVLNRTPGNAHAMVAALGAPTGVEVVARVADLAEREYDLVVNATPLGLKPDDPLPIDFRVVGRVGAILDTAYSASGTRCVGEALSLGIAAADGREMLVQQAAASFKIWWGLDAPLEAMREAVGLT